MMGTFLGLTGCTKSPEKPDFGRWYYFAPIQDEQRLPQTGTTLVQKCSVDPDRAQNANTVQNFDTLRQQWLMAWQNKSCNWKKEALLSLNILKDCYRENFQRCTDRLWIQSVQDNANFQNFDRVALPGVILEHAAVRHLPTDFPCYYKKEGFDFAPLDRLQNTFLNASTPVYISHYSKDRAWVMIEDVAGKAVGFVKSSQVSIMTRSECNTVADLPIAVFSKDNHPIYTESGAFLGYSRLGQVVFVQKQDPEFVWILWPKVSSSNAIQWKTVRLSKDLVHTSPLLMSDATLAYVLDQLLGKPYGWGGTLGNRDCSAMIQDYFRLFGFALPRNSKAQMENSGIIIPLSSQSKAEKERLIVQKGVPYRTILYAPGHVTLYVGTLQGQVCMAHALWAIGFVKNGFDGSHVVGKSLVSHLDIHGDTPGMSTPFSDKITAMIIVQ